MLYKIIRASIPVLAGAWVGVLSYLMNPHAGGAAMAALFISLGLVVAARVY